MEHETVPRCVTQLVDQTCLANIPLDAVSYVTDVRDSILADEIVDQRGYLPVSMIRRCTNETGLRQQETRDETTACEKPWSGIEASHH